MAESEKSCICFFNSTHSWGGGEKWHYDISSALHSEEENIVVFTNRKSELYERVSRLKIKCYSVKVSKLSFLNPIKIIKLLVLFRKLNIQIIILNLPSDLKFAGIAAYLAGVKNIIYRRGSAISVKNSFLNRFLFSKILTGVIVNSNATKNALLEKNENLISKDKIKLLYNGINLPDYLTKKINTKQSQKIIIGNAGRLVKQKAQKKLIEIALILRDKNIDFKIIIAGEGKLRPEIEALIAKNKLEKQFELQGFIKDMDKFFEQIDIFVLTSYWEGFGYVLAEAMANGKPLIGFDISSNPELINAGKNGFLIKPFNCEEFAFKIIELYFDKDKMETFSKNGIEMARTRFDINLTYQKTKEYLFDLLKA